MDEIKSSGLYRNLASCMKEGMRADGIAVCIEFRCPSYLYSTQSCAFGGGLEDAKSSKLFEG